MGRFLHDLFEDAGEAWMPEDIARHHRLEVVQVARFMMGHCHLGNFCLPREDHSEDCPLCGEPYSRVHFLTKCEALVDLRSQWLDGVDCGGWCGMIASALVVSLWVSGISFQAWTVLARRISKLKSFVCFLYIPHWVFSYSVLDTFLASGFPSPFFASLCPVCRLWFPCSWGVILLGVWVI